jgi:ribosomal protein S18 acetylase RimI-like enzyme
MNITIKNPQEDQHGNQKENIFIAFDNNNQYIGHAYLVLTVNHDQIKEIPVLIYFDIELVIEDKTTRRFLFDNVMKRARVLRARYPHYKALAYTGFMTNNEKLAFYLENGLTESYTIIMEKSLSDHRKTDCNFDLRVKCLNIHSEDLTHYEHAYNKLFLTPLDKNMLFEQSKNAHFNLLEFYEESVVIGGCTLFEKDGYGYLESLYILPSERGKGYAKKIMNYVLNYFASVNLSKSQLEVWDRNRVALNLYRSLGYQEVKNQMMLPGKDL